MVSRGEGDERGGGVFPFMNEFRETCDNIRILKRQPRGGMLKPEVDIAWGAVPSSIILFKHTCPIVITGFRWFHCFEFYFSLCSRSGVNDKEALFCRPLPDGKTNKKKLYRSVPNSKQMLVLNIIIT